MQLLNITFNTKVKNIQKTKKSKVNNIFKFLYDNVALK